MIKIDDYLVPVSVLDVLKEIQSVTASIGEPRLKDIHSDGTGHNVMITCPVHKNGQEKTPSCGVSLIDKDVPEGTAHCFTCGWSGSLEKLVSACFQKDDQGYFGKKWMIENFIGGQLFTGGNLFKGVDYTKKEKKSTLPIDENVLTMYNMDHPHTYLLDRGISPYVIDVFGLGLDNSFPIGDKEYSCITIPVRDEHGRLVFLARRTIEGKIYHYPKDSSKPVFGLYEVKKHFPNTAYVLITEGIFDALKAWTHGYPAIALLGTGSLTQYEILKRQPYRKYIIALDGDEAGTRGTQKLVQQLKPHKFIDIMNLPFGKDVGDLTKDEFESLCIMPKLFN